MKHYCDTNFIISYLLGEDPEIFKKAKEVFVQVQTGKASLILEQTVFTEMIFVLSSFYQIPKNKIAEVLSELLTYKGIICEDKDSLLSALRLYNEYNLHIVDCLLLAKAEKHNRPPLSFDQKLLDIYNKRRDL